MSKLLEIKNLYVSFKTHAGIIKAIRGVNLYLEKGEILAVVGESGSGKSVTSKVLIGLLVKNAIVESGQVLYKNQDLLNLTKKEQAKIRGKEIAMIFQDPMTALNPTMKVGKQIAESIVENQNLSKKAAKEKAIELIKLVGITEAEKRYNSYPHQLSGGMRQRIVIAIALACKPEILIADEPTTALDVTIQSQIIELIKELQKKIGLSIIFITHNLGVVAQVADRVAVMYAGKIVEYGKAEEIFYEPKHPYTWGLLGSVPDMEDKSENLYSIPGSPPNLLHPPKGDAFSVRSEYSLKIDIEEEPPFFEVSPTHFAATWLLHEDAPKVEIPNSLRERIDRMKKDGD